jgi:aminopeptidase N
MLRLLLGLVEDPEAPIPESFLDAFRRALMDDAGDAALRAEVLTLPSETYLADQMAVVDVDGIHRARQRLRRRIGEALHPDLLRVFDAGQETGPYAFSPQGVARRSLKNLALGYLMAGISPGALERCQGQFEAAHNMTDQTAALWLLVDRGGPEAESALEAFYGRW